MEANDLVRSFGGYNTPPLRLTLLMLILCEGDAGQLVIPVDRGRLFEEPSKIRIAITLGFPPEY